MTVDRKRFVKDALGTLITKLFLIIIKLGTSVVTARLLGPEGRGVFYSSVQTSGVVGTAGSMSVGEALTYFISRGEISKGRVFSTVFFVWIGISTVMFCSLYALMPLVEEHFLKEIDSKFYLWICLLLPGMMGEYLVTATLRGLHLFKLTNKLNVITRVALLGSIVVSVAVYGVTTMNAIAGYVCGLLINAMVYFLLLFINTPKKSGVDFAMVPKIFKYGGSVHIGTLLTEVEYRADIFVLLFFLNATAVGLYSISATLAQILWYISNAVNNVLFPYLSKAKGEDKNDFTSVVLRYTMPINLLVVSALMIVGQWVIELLYGEEYSESYYIFLILGPGLLFDSISRVLSSWLKSTGNAIYLSKIAGVGLCINISLNIFLIPLYGVYGAAIASTISYFIRAMIMLAYYLRETKRNAFDVLILRADEAIGLIKRLRAVVARGM